MQFNTTSCLMIIAGTHVERHKLYSNIVRTHDAIYVSAYAVATCVYTFEFYQGKLMGSISDC